jgi:hypothetical protein
MYIDLYCCNITGKVVARHQAVPAPGRHGDVTKGHQVVVTQVEAGRHGDGGRRVQVAVEVDLKRMIE